jgi:endonuclease YncB( thermonuclease family)
MRTSLSRTPLAVVAAILAVVVAVVAVSRLDRAGPSTAGLEAIDADTVRSNGVVFRLLGFDAPERGDGALCDKERELGETAAARLRELLARGDAKLERSACPCPSGTEGTQACNAGRSCATLSVAGANVGNELIREGLARPFVCGATSCPPRRTWC